jgi:hypothetical protein
MTGMTDLQDRSAREFEKLVRRCTRAVLAGHDIEKIFVSPNGLVSSYAGIFNLDVLYTAVVLSVETSRANLDSARWID